jgi:hypothetical protein
MEKRIGNKKLPIANRENIAVSRPEPVVSIPVAQVVAVAVPLLIVSVPVAVPVEHGTGFVFRTIRTTAFRIHENGCILFGASKLASAKYQW